MKLLSAVLCNLCVLSASTIFAAESSMEKAPKNCNNRPVRPMRVSARYTTPDGIGYKPGYTTVEGFFSKKTQNDWVPFLDLRGHVFDDGKLAANAGLGLRHLWGKRVWGVNGYYDYRNTSHQHYNQVAAGLEWLGRVWDFRLNGYLPVGDKESHLFGSRFKEFSGHHMLLKTKRDFAFKGANFEIGVHVDTFKKAPLYFNFGPYYLTGKGATTWGGEARGAVDLFNRYLRIEGNVSYDHFFKWVGQGQFSVNIPFGKRQRINRNFSCCMELAMLDRLVQRVDRNEIVPVGREHLTRTAINPATGLPYYFVFVDNTSSSDGTFESPYPTLVQAQDASSVNDIIYIFPGNQTTTGMDAGITLKDGQKLWGSVVAHALPTQLGSIQIPAQSIGRFIDNAFGTSIAMVPMISATGNVVNIANNNEIDGLYIQSTMGGNAINGPVSISNLIVRHCTLQTPAGSGEGIALTDLAGELVVEKNSITARRGILFSNTTSNLNASILNNQIMTGLVAVSGVISNQGSLQVKDNLINVTGSANGLLISQSANSNLIATVSNNKIIAAAAAVVLTANGTTTFTLRSNEFTNGISGNTIQISQNTGSLNGVIEDNTIYGIGTGALFNTTGVDAAIAFRSNTFASGIGDATLREAIQIVQTTGSLAAKFDGNNMVASNHGILVTASGDAAALTFGSNTITSTQGMGIDLQHNLGSLAATVSNNNITAEIDNGFNYDNSGGADGITAALNVKSNTIDASQPINVNQNFGDVTASIANNILIPRSTTNPALNDTFNIMTTGTQNATFTGNTVTQGKGEGFFFDIVGAGTANWTIDDNMFYGLADHAVNIRSAIGATANLCVTFNDNTAYPILLTGGAGTYLFDNSAGGGTFTLNPPMGNIGVLDTANVIIGPCP